MSTITPEAPRAVRIIELGEDGAPTFKSLLIVEVGTRLVFSMRPTTKVSMDSLAVWTNCPFNPEDPFDRHVFSCLEGSDQGPLNLNGDWQTYIDIQRPGCYEFFAEFERNVDGTQIAVSPIVRTNNLDTTVKNSLPQDSMGNGLLPSRSLPPFRGIPLNSNDTNNANNGDNSNNSTRSTHQSQIMIGTSTSNNTIYRHRSHRTIMVRPPDAARRGPIARFVVQPELVIRLLRPLLSSFPASLPDPHPSLPSSTQPSILNHDNTNDPSMNRHHRSTSGSVLLYDTNTSATNDLGIDAEDVVTSSDDDDDDSNHHHKSTTNRSSSEKPPTIIRRSSSRTNKGFLDTPSKTDNESNSNLPSSSSTVRPRIGSHSPLLSAVQIPPTPSSPISFPSSETITPMILPGLTIPDIVEYEEVLLPLPLEGITLQTQLTRCLGPIDSWLNYLPISEALKASLEGYINGIPSPSTLLWKHVLPLSTPHGTSHSKLTSLQKQPSGIFVLDDDGMRVSSSQSSALPSSPSPSTSSGIPRVVVGSLSEPLACKYNFLHFTPVQRLGGSNSCYSLADQLCLEWDIFAGNKAVLLALAQTLFQSSWCQGTVNNNDTKLLLTSPVSFAKLHNLSSDPSSSSSSPPDSSTEFVGDLPRSIAEEKVWSHPRVEGAKMAVLSTMIRALEAHHGVLSLVDIVLNHTSTDSRWLRNHPEAGYSLRNSPHLRAAFELDETILRVSAAVRNGKIPGLGPHMRDDGTVNAVVDAIQHHSILGLPAARLWEFYVIDVKGTLAATASLLPGIELPDDCTIDNFTQADNVEGGDTAVHGPPAALHSTGVTDQTLSRDRRFEILSSRHPIIKTILMWFRTHGYEGNGGEGCVPVSDHDINRLAAQLCEQPAPPPVQEAVALLRREYVDPNKGTLDTPHLLSRESSLGSGLDDSVHRVSLDPTHTVPPFFSSSSLPIPPIPNNNNNNNNTSNPSFTDHLHIQRGLTMNLKINADPVVSSSSSALLSRTRSKIFPVPFSAYPDSGDRTPIASPLSSPLPDHTAPLPDALYIGGRPPNAPTDMQHPHLASTHPTNNNNYGNNTGHLSPDFNGSRYGYGNRSVSRPRSVTGNSSVYRNSNRRGSLTTPSNAHGSTASSVTGPLSVAESIERDRGDANQFRGGAYNDGTGSRFAVHLDIDLAIAALNTLHGVRIAPDDWTWPGLVNTHGLLSPASSSDNEQVHAPNGTVPAPPEGDPLRPTSGAGVKSLSGTTLGLLPSLHLINRLVNAINIQLYRRYDNDISSALNAVRGTAKYQWLNVWGGKESLTVDRPIVWSYFTRVPVENMGGKGRASATVPYGEDQAETTEAYEGIDEGEGALNNNTTHANTGTNTNGGYHYLLDKIDEDDNFSPLAARAIAMERKITPPPTTNVPLPKPVKASSKIPSQDKASTVTEKVHVLACNGFIWNGDPEIDFTLPVDIAKVYAELVRVGTADIKYVKRSRHRSSSSSNPSMHPTDTANERKNGSGAGTLREPLTSVGAAANTTTSAGFTIDPNELLPSDPPSTNPSLNDKNNTTTATPVPLFLGADLLEYTENELSNLLEAYNSGNWKAIYGYENQAAMDMEWPGEDTGYRSSSYGLPSENPYAPSFPGSSASSLPSSPYSVSYPDWDEIPHLRPDALPLPLCCASTPYMRRDIVIWGDCVKLRYGLSPKDSPWLWRHMRIYVRRMARIFHGLRVDNAHGTPLHVAAAMIDTAREIRPSLYVNAELFTGSLERDIEYVSRLGINSLVREAMQASDPRDLIRCVYSYGGAPVGSLRPPLRGGSAAERIEALLRTKPPAEVFASSGGIVGELLLSNGSTQNSSNDHTHSKNNATVKPHHPLRASSFLRALLPPSASTDSLNTLGLTNLLNSSGTTPSSNHPYGNSGSSSNGFVGMYGSGTGNSIHGYINGFNIAALLATDRRAHLARMHHHQNHGTLSNGGVSSPALFIHSHSRTSTSSFNDIQALETVNLPTGTLGNSPSTSPVPYSHAPYGTHTNSSSFTKTSIRVRMNEAAVAEVLPSPLPALFFDCTHDNVTPNEKRHAADAAASLAIVATTVCAGGTTRGFDILVPENLSVVTDHRIYGDHPHVLSKLLRNWSLSSSATQDNGIFDNPSDDTATPEPSVAHCVGLQGSKFAVDMNVGLRLVRRRLNALKQEMAARGQTEIYVQADNAPNGADLVTIIRGHPSLPISYLVLCRTAFNRFAGEARGWSGELPVIRVEGCVTGVVMVSSLTVPHQSVNRKPPQGKLLHYPSVFSNDHDAQKLIQKLHTVLDEHDNGNSDTNVSLPLANTTPRYPLPDSGSSSNGIVNGNDINNSYNGQWSADPMLINGLRCENTYWDDTMPHPLSNETISTIDTCTYLSASTLGLASFREESTDDSTKDTRSGHAVTYITLDGNRFNAGSILVLKIRAPRNVALRASQILSTATAPSATVSLSHDSTVARETPSSTDKGTNGTRILSRADSVPHLLHGSPTPDHRKSIGQSSGGNSLPISPRTNTMLTPAKMHNLSQRSLVMQRSVSVKKMNASVYYGPTLADLHDTLISNPNVTLTILNHLLYRSNPEERDDSFGLRGIYEVPGLSIPLPWAGLAGLQYSLRHCRRWNDMGHPLLENIRRGSWLMDYITGRLVDYPQLDGVRLWLERHFTILKGMPAGLRPQGFDRVVTAAYHAAVAACLARMGGILVPAHHFHSQHYLVQMPGIDNDRRNEVEAAYFRGERTEWDSDTSDTSDNEEEEEEEKDEGDSIDEDGFGPSKIARNGLTTPVPRRIRMHGTLGLSVIEGHTDPSAPLPFVTALTMTSVMLWGQARSAPLLSLPLLEIPRNVFTAKKTTELPIAETTNSTDVSSIPSGMNGGQHATELSVALASLAAGVDHFCTGYMRNWGRDTFISLRGLLLVPGRFAEARSTLLAFATVVRHGLVPNLMDGGRNPRYNCRDAVWWFLQALQDYCCMSPEGIDILATRIHRRYPSDDPNHYDTEGMYTGPSVTTSPTVTSLNPLHCTLGELVQEIMEKHAKGIHFREWNAGPRIDAHMRDEGFQISITLNLANGFLYGGNQWNCGTWMDKMGSANSNNGEPATPRDGAPIEITGLLYSTVKWLSLIHETHPHLFPYTGVLNNALPYKQWRETIKNSFEYYYYVPFNTNEDTLYHVNTGIVNRRTIYRDTLGGSREWADYQLRPNQLITMAIAGDLFNPAHAAAALLVIERQLLGERQLGVKTLDPDDWAYRGNYDNSADGDRSTARGWNYHQGPEWLWPYGYYLRARMQFPPPIAIRYNNNNDNTNTIALGNTLVSPTHLTGMIEQQSLTSTTGSTNTMTNGTNGTSSSVLAPSTWPSFATMRRWVYGRLSRHRVHLEAVPEAGLPELTNSNGNPCKDSCTVQAWSSATLLDALYDLYGKYAKEYNDSDEKDGMVR